MGYSPWGHKRFGHSLMTKEQQGVGLAKLEEWHLKASGIRWGVDRNRKWRKEEKKVKSLAESWVLV